MCILWLVATLVLCKKRRRAISPLQVMYVRRLVSRIHHRAEWSGHLLTEITAVVWLGCHYWCLFWRCLRSSIRGSR